MSSSQPTPSVPTDRNLLFGVLALQADLLDAAQFAEACTAWSGRKDKTLAELLVERGWLSADDRRDVERLLERKLKKHAGDVHASLAAALRTPTRVLLAGVADPDIQQSLSTCLPDQPGDSSAAGRVLLSTTAYHPESRQRYTLTRMHAKGGLGQVWLARDDDLDRDVALKEVRTDKANQEAVLARFVEEARITGQLQHPGIVPVYELARRSKDQQPFYTMRFVEGRTLREASKEYHRKRQAGETGPLDLRELLGQFIGVCNAIAYAHDRGVLHRDLKGPNVIVGDFGEVIVLDWGLAKVVGKSEARTAPSVKLEPSAERGETIQGQALGTPGYMSPEQAVGRLDQVNERSDVYGLGAILYEILTGEPPFTGEDKEEVLRRVAREAVVPPRSLVPETPRALEAICLKALAKDRAERYGSAAALATEIRHYLADEPVAAYRDPLVAKGGRWARRHRTLVAGLTAAALVAVVSLTAATVLLSAANSREAEARQQAQKHSKEAERQEAKAKANFQLARDAVEQYCTKVSDDPRLKEKDLEELRKELLESAVQFHQKFVDQHHDDPGLRADLGRAYLDLGAIVGESDYTQGVHLSRQAAAIYEELIALDPAEGSYPLQLAQALIDLGGVMDTHGQTKEARTALEQALQTLESVRQQQGSSQLFRRLYALASTRLAYLVYDKLGLQTEAIAIYRRAVALLEDGQAPAPTDLTDARAAANLYISLGEVLSAVGNARQEGPLQCEKGLQLLEQRLSPTYRPPALLSNLAGAYCSMGIVQRSLSQRESEVQSYRKAVELSEELVAAHPVVATYQHELGAYYNNLSMAQLEAGQTQQALASLKKAVEVKERLAVRYPDVPDYQANLVRSLANLAGYTTDFKEARTYQHRAEVLAKELNRLHPGVVQYQTALAGCLRTGAELHQRANEFQEATAAQDEAIDVWEKVVQTTDVAEHRNKLTLAYLLKSVLALQAGKPELAAEALGKANALHATDPVVFYEYGIALAKANLWEDAALAQSKAVELKPDYAQAHCNLGHSLVRQGRFVEGRAALQRGHELGSKQPGWDYPSARWVLDADKLIQFDDRLTAILDGKVKPTNAADELNLALFCQRYNRGNAAAARFFAAAFAERPQFAEDLKAGHRYNAACAATLAGCGQGKDADKLDDKERARLRKQALDWLRADLTAWGKLLEKDGDKGKPLVQGQMVHWKEDADLVDVRNPKALEKLPQDERNAWHALWQDVEALLVKTQEKK